MKKIIFVFLFALAFTSCEDKSNKPKALYDQNQSPSEEKVVPSEQAGINVGEIAPEINLPTPDGKMVKLSSLRGKYVLIDFWASWCGPCRMENPNVVRVYETYKDKGFEIYGVSLDRTKEQWVEAIKADGISWVQVSDLAFWNSVVVPQYRISGIPATILLDKDGRIIARDLRGQALEDKLKEILG